jgi:glycosyltransferase involved in cell wall biosynthesis
MIRILYVLSSFIKRSGITSVALNYYNNIDSDIVHIDFMVLPSSERSMIEYVQSKGSKVFIMPRLTGMGVWRYCKFMKDFFRDNRYDIVHSHFNQVDSIIFPIAKNHGVKHCISHSHNTRYSNSRIKSVRNWLMCLPIKKYADTWAACSTLAGEFLYGREFRKSPKALLINNAIETNRYRFNPIIREEKKRQLGIAEDQIVLGNVGSLNPQKNQVFLLHVFADLVKQDIENKYLLIIISDGLLKNMLVEQAEKLAISDKVLFLGRRDDVNQLFQVMDVFLLPSLYEGLPVVGVEAQASGLPCLFSDTITREVEICNSFFLDINNGTQVWVDSIMKVIDFDRKDESKAFREKGFDIKKEASRLTYFYNEIIQK